VAPFRTMKEKNMPPPKSVVRYASFNRYSYCFVALTQKLLLLRFVTIVNFFFSFNLLAELYNFNLTCLILLNLAPVKVIRFVQLPLH